MSVVSTGSIGLIIKYSSYVCWLRVDELIPAFRHRNTIFVGLGLRFRTHRRDVGRGLIMIGRLYIGTISNSFTLQGSILLRTTVTVLHRSAARTRQGNPQLPSFHARTESLSLAVSQPTGVGIYPRTQNPQTSNVERRISKLARISNLRPRTFRTSDLAAARKGSKETASELIPGEGGMKVYDQTGDVIRESSVNVRPGRYHQPFRPRIADILVAVHIRRGSRYRSKQLRYRWYWR